MAHPLPIRFALPLALTCAIGTVVAQDAIGTTTAISAGQISLLTRGDFEAGFNGIVPQPAWNPWTFTGTAGICHESAPGMSASVGSPNGVNVAFLDGQGAVSVPTPAATTGLWRMRFLGAQRVTGAGNDAQAVSVVVGATQVFREPLKSSQYDQYVTRPFELLAQATITISGLNVGHAALIDQVEFEPIAEWGVAGSWTNGIPGPTIAVIPAGVVVAVRGNASADTLTVQGELLALPADVNLDTRWVMVHGMGARLEVGQPGTPYLQKFHLMLTGDAVAEDVMGAGSKFLMAMDGAEIDMHGTPKGIALPDGRMRTWTKLGASVAQNATQITVSEPVNWQANDWIVITGSFDGHISSATEDVRQIQSVSPNGLTITLMSGVTFPHDGAPPTPFSTTFASGPHTWVLDRRAEVGLLTHNVKISGVTSQAQPTFGGHVMIMRGGMGGAGVGRFSGVEFFQMGQKQRLARYPVHWHMMFGTSAGQFLKHCSIHKSWNRAVTVHGSEGVLIEGNVAYDHIGHGMFLEDGSERFNQFYYNLALQTRRPPVGEELLPTDNFPRDTMQNNAPATYWITNPNNTFVGNVAAGTVGTGFWFAFPDAPTGLSTGAFPGLFPRLEPLGEFRGNLCHASASALDINDRIRTDHTLEENVGWLPPQQSFLDQFTVYGCRFGIYISGGSAYEQIVFRDAVITDNLLGFVGGAIVILKESVFIRDSGTGFGPTNTGAHGIYDGQHHFHDCHFVGFDVQAPLAGNGFPKWLTLASVGGAVREVGQRYRGITSAPNPLFWELADNDPGSNGVFGDSRDWTIAMVDEDGSITGHTPVSGRPFTLVSNHPMMRTRSDLGVNGVHAFASPHDWARLHVMHPGMWPPPTVDFTRNLIEPNFNPPILPVLFSNAPLPPPAPIDYRRKCAVIVDRPGQVMVGYDVSWPVLPATRVVELELGSLVDYAAGTSCIVSLATLGLPTALVSVQNPDQTWSPLPIGGNVVAFVTSTQTAAYIDPLAPSPKPLHLRYVKSAGMEQQRLSVTW